MVIQHTSPEKSTFSSECDASVVAGGAQSQLKQFKICLSITMRLILADATLIALVVTGLLVRDSPDRRRFDRPGPESAAPFPGHKWSPHPEPKSLRAGCLPGLFA